MAENSVKVYLQQDFKGGKYYEYSKTAKDGFEEHTSNRGNTSYRKYYNMVFGTFEGATIRDFGRGSILNITMKDGGTYINIQYNLHDQSGFVDGNYVESVLRVLPAMEKGKAYRVLPYYMTEDREGNPMKYPNIGVSVYTADLSGDEPQALEKVQPVYGYSAEQFDADHLIPKLVWKEKNIGGQMKNRPTPASKEIKSDFLQEIANALNAKYEFKRGESTPAQENRPSESPVNQASKTFENSGEDLDELPF